MHGVVSNAIVRLAKGPGLVFLGIDTGGREVTISRVLTDAASHYTLPRGWHADGAKAVEDVLESGLRADHITGDRRVCRTLGQLRRNEGMTDEAHMGRHHYSRIRNRFLGP